MTTKDTAIQVKNKFNNVNIQVIWMRSIKKVILTKLIGLYFHHLFILEVRWCTKKIFAILSTNASFKQTSETYFTIGLLRPGSITLITVHYCSESYLTFGPQGEVKSQLMTGLWLTISGHVTAAGSSIHGRDWVVLIDYVSVDRIVVIASCRKGVKF